MEDRGLRDVERWKDKIEVRLDNWQVCFLFFGSALVACLLFVLGVIVGKRLEARGKAVAPEIEDPLALLDKVAASPRAAAPEAPALPKALLGVASAARQIAPAPRPEARPAALAKAEPPKAAPPKADPAPAARPEATPKPEPKPAAVARPEPAARPAEAPRPAANDAAKPRTRFALQIGSFPDRAEAEAFAKRFGGENPSIVPSDIPGKGTWFRVRVGEYASAKDAIAAKTSFEKQHSVIALVVPPPPSSPATAVARTSAPR